MKDFFSRIEALWVSVAFAEAGEHETSQQILSQDIHESLEADPCLTT